jgi:hypothetical protein
MNLLECITDAIAWAQMVESDPDITKDLVIEGLVMRCNTMVNKLLVNPQSTSLSTNGWQLQHESIVNTQTN